MNNKKKIFFLLDTRRSLIAILVITATVLVYYSPSINYEFINWDDTSYTIKDKIVSKGLGKESLHHAFTTFNNPYFMPLTRLSYMLDVTLFGKDDASGFRLVNIFIHAAICLLLFSLVLQASKRFWASFFISVLFAIHPQHIESVVWVAGRKELLAGLLGVLSLYSYQQYSFKHKREYYLLTILFFSLSLLCKPMWLGLPLLLLVWDFFPLKKLGAGTVKSCIVEKLPFLAISIVYALLFSHFLSEYMTGLSSASFFPDEPWSRRWLFLFIGLGEYVTNTFFPVHLIPYYPFPDSVNVLKGIIWIFVPTLLLIFFWRLRFKNPGLLMAALWFGISIAVPLRLCILPAGEAMFVGDRLTYMAHIGLFTGLILGIDHWANLQNKVMRQMTITLLLILFASYTYSGQYIIKQWRTPESLWLYTLNNVEGTGRAYVLGLLATEYHKKERYADALLVYQTAHETNPTQYIYPLMVGSLLNAPFSREEDSNAWFDKILDEAPAPVNVLYKHGKLELFKGHALRAEKFLLKAYQRNQHEYSNITDENILLSLGIARTHAFKIAEAVSAFQKIPLPGSQKKELCSLIHRIINKKNQQLTSEQQQLLSNFCKNKSNDY